MVNVVVEPGSNISSRFLDLYVCAAAAVFAGQPDRRPDSAHHRGVHRFVVLFLKQGRSWNGHLSGWALQPILKNFLTEPRLLPKNVDFWASRA